MGDSRYQRVTRARPCVICGKPDWCSRASNGSISFCARVTTGADRLSRKDNWGVFYHDRSLLERNQIDFIQPTRSTKSESVSLAPLEIRDFVYTSLLRLSPASSYDVLITGSKGLAERGLTDYDDYGSLPASFSERKELARCLRSLLNQNFPRFALENTYGIAAVPGFWLDENGDACLWQDKNYRQPMLLVPYRSPRGKIQACQIRITGSFAVKTKRYFWLSNPNRNSAGSGTPIHFADWKNFANGIPQSQILITEGALKADVVRKHHPEYATLATGGVSCAHETLVNLTRGKNVYLAFDNDYRTNKSVFRQIARFIQAFSDDLGLPLSDCHSLHFLDWDNCYKGVDDAILKASTITTYPLRLWLNRLSSYQIMELQQSLNFQI